MESNRVIEKFLGTKNCDFKFVRCYSQIYNGPLQTYGIKIDGKLQQLRKRKFLI